MSGTVPIFDPQGTLRDVPMDQFKAAVAAGGKPAVRFEAPDKSIRFVPANRTADAVKAGGKMLPIEQQDVQHPGVWHAIADDALGVVKGIASTGLTAMQVPAGLQEKIGLNPPDVIAQAKALPTQDQARKAAGYSGPYRALAPVAQMAGVNVPAMEQSAAEGDVGGVAGRTVVPAAAIAAPLAAEAVSPLTKPITSRITEPISSAVGEASKKMYQSALKPSTTIPPGRVAAMVKTGLESKIPISPAGLDKLGGLIDDVNKNIADTIASDPNRPINKFKVTSRLGDTADKFATQVNPEADMGAISEAGNEFLRNQPGEIPASQAQALKQGTYQQLKGKAYGELKSATIESQKALARGLKEEINDAFPEIKDMNAQDSAFYNLQGVLEKAVQRNANHQLVGIGTPMVAAGAKALTKSTGVAAVAATMKALVDDPYVKSRLAIALNHQGIPLSAANSRIAAYSAALGASANAQAQGDQTNGAQQ